MADESLQQAFDQAIQHHQAGRLADAEKLYRQILAQQPNHPDALQLLGVIACQVGRQTIGADLIRQAIALKPNWPEAYSNLGSALMTMGKHDDAIGAYRSAIGISPNYPQGHYNLANALMAKGRFDDAIAEHRIAIALKPDYADAHGNLGSALAAKGRFDEAIDAYRRAIALHPNWPEAWLNLGNALKDKAQMDDAAAAYRQAIALRPTYPEAHSNLGNVLSATGNLDEAIAAFRQAIAHRPNFPEAYANLGNTLRDRGLYDQSIAACRHSIALKPDHPGGHSNLALALLLRGEFRQGWSEFEWRWKCTDLASSRPAFTKPQWNGSDLSNGTLLLNAEQGFGDTFQFIRYVPMVTRRCRKVVIACPPELRRLLQTTYGPLLAPPAGESPPPFDAHCPLMSLPLIFGTTLETIPKSVPYLQADAAEIARWGKRIVGDHTGMKVGLVWAGRPDHKNDRNRSLPLSLLTSLTQVKGVDFYSLQKGMPAEQAKTLAVTMNLTYWTEELNDFGDTAALIANLDLVVSVDTAVAHLAGAMGKPVSILLPFVPDWRWLLDREDSPWYPSMRLFRQEAPGDWGEVIERIAGELRGLVSRGRVLANGGDMV